MVFDPARLRYVPISVLTTPFAGAVVLRNYWWAVDLDRGAIFFGSPADQQPQCNRDEAVLNALRNKFLPQAAVQQISVAYIRRSVF